jgi:hypothetical protein
MPSWVRIGVEHRGRLEGPIGTGFVADREDLYWLNRFRVTARFSITPWLSAAVQAQDARVEGRNGPVAGAPFRDQFDLRLAHADMGNLGIGVGAPGHHQAGNLLPPLEQGVGDEDAGLGVGGMGEFVGGTDVPCGVDAGVPVSACGTSPAAMRACRASASSIPWDNCETVRALHR